MATRLDSGATPTTPKPFFAAATAPAHLLSEYARRGGSPSCFAFGHVLFRSGNAVTAGPRSSAAQKALTEQALEPSFYVAGAIESRQLSWMTITAWSLDNTAHQVPCPSVSFHASREEFATPPTQLIERP